MGAKKWRLSRFALGYLFCWPLWTLTENPEISSPGSSFTWLF